MLERQKLREWWEGRRVLVRAGATCPCHHPGPHEVLPILAPPPPPTPPSLRCSPVSPRPAPHSRSSDAKKVFSQTRTREHSHKDTGVAGTVFAGPGGPAKCPGVTSLVTPPGGQPGSFSLPPSLVPYPPPSLPCLFRHPLPSVSYWLSTQTLPLESLGCSLSQVPLLGVPVTCSAESGWASSVTWSPAS